jgi:hypothetical protein
LLLLGEASVADESEDPMKPLLIVPTLLVALGCATAQLQGPPGQDAGPPACLTAVDLPCETATPGAPSCTPELAWGVAGAATYPLGCRAYFMTPDCSLESSCACVLGDAGGGVWSCTP